MYIAVFSETSKSSNQHAMLKGRREGKKKKNEGKTVRKK
jgi:hypothetical protein